MTENVRYYRNADITLQVSSDLPFKPDTFDRKFEKFRVEEPGEDMASIHHHFSLPEIDLESLGKPAYFKAPWSIYPSEDGWVYMGIMPEEFKKSFWIMATFNHDHSVGHIYHPIVNDFFQKNMQSLTGFTTDQIWMARLLADRQGCYMHSAAVILDKAGLLFVGHSNAGKSTTTDHLINANKKNNLDVEVLCDDRNIVRFWQDSWQLYGSWSHGDIPLVSAESAPLQAICFLEQAKENVLIRITDQNDIIKRMLSCLIKPLVTLDWWHKELDMVERLSSEVPCYVMKFDKSGKITEALKALVV